MTSSAHAAATIQVLSSPAVALLVVTERHVWEQPGSVQA